MTGHRHVSILLLLTQLLEIISPAASGSRLTQTEQLQCSSSSDMSTADKLALSASATKDDSISGLAKAGFILQHTSTRNEKKLIP